MKNNKKWSIYFNLELDFYIYIASGPSHGGCYIA